MESMDRRKEYLLTVHPVRKTAAQKEEFRRWLTGELKRSGWKAHEETYGRFNGSVNVIAGDPDRAAIFLCTHYDTAARSLIPNFVSPTNVAAHIVYHLAAGLLLAALALIVSFAVSFPLNQPGLMLPLFLVLAVALLWTAAYGPANRNNANSSTSGVLALLSIAKAVSYDKRVCLLFLDNNARNLLGAAAFRKKHIDQATGTLFVNLDCVGDGENLLLIPSKYSRWDAGLLDALEKAFPDTGAVHPHILNKGLQYYPSDQRRFKYNTTICACRYLSGLGYYIPHLGTKRDTILRDENIAYLTQCMTRFLPLYLNQEG